MTTSNNNKAYLINTFDTITKGDGDDLTGSDDSLLVTSTGALYVKSGGDGVDSSGIDESITIDGLVASVIGQNAIGVKISGNNTTLTVTGQIVGSFLGVETTAASEDNAVNIGTQGVVDGGIAISGSTSTVNVDGQVSEKVGLYGAQDSVDVGTDGSILNGVESTRGTSTVTVDGQVASFGDGADIYGDDNSVTVGASGSVRVSGPPGSDGIYLDGSTNSVVVNGAVSGNLDGVYLLGNTDSLVVGAQGSVEAVGTGTTGVDMLGGADVVTVKGDVEAGANGVYVGGDGDTLKTAKGATIDSTDGGYGVQMSGPDATSSFSLFNSGDIFGAVGVYFTIGGGDTIDNSGEISGSQTGIFLSANKSAGESIENSGTIEGGSAKSSSGIATAGSASGVQIVNSGLITNSAGNAITGPGAVLYFDDVSGAVSTIDNTGTVSGAGYVIQSESDTLEILNSGAIHGGVYSTAPVYLYSSGVLHGPEAKGSNNVLWLRSAVNVVDNSQTGVITGSLNIQGSGDKIDNAGHIDGQVVIAAGDDTLTNTGDMDGEILFTGADTSNTLTNSGAITGNVTLAGAKSTLINSGAITGNVTLTGANSALTNHNQLYGDVSLVLGDTLTNTGTIHGDVTLAIEDTFDSSRGEVTGAITASTADTFDYEGLFGVQTIDGFIASGSSHDTIQFAANDFGGFSAVQHAMSQVGADTLIRLDANDSITLVGVTTSSLVAADFKFT